MPSFPKKRKSDVTANQEGTAVVKKGKKKSKPAEDSSDVVEIPVKKMKREKKVANAQRESPLPAAAESKKRRKRKSNAKGKRHGTLTDVAVPRVDTVYMDDSTKKTFSDFELDERILKGIGALGWEKPTDVQHSMIPLALEGKNIMARARTGSGKTAAFVLPILQRVIQVASTNLAALPGPLAVFLAPSKELASQVHTLLTSLLKPLPFLSFLNLSELSESEKSVWENDRPHLVVTTPGKLSTMLKLRGDFLSVAKHVVLDEADLVLSFGYENEMRFLRSSLPSHYQCIMTSATLTDDMSQLKSLFMTGPALTIKLKEGDLPDCSRLTQYQLSVETEEQRFAILLSLFKLKLIVGKTIIFVNTTDRSYKLSIFLSAFNIRSCILNAAMPANSRSHVINEFNKGEYPVVVASDVTDVNKDLAEPDGEDKQEDEPEKKKKKGGRRKLDKEAGVARGIDFHHVSNVINFDFPSSLEAYIHRVGRTARGFNKGTALSFCTPSEELQCAVVKEEMSKQLGEDVLQPYEMRIKELDSFVLRAREALAACTKMVIREARLAEIRNEVLRSAKLQAYFAKNPRERDLLEKEKKLHTLNLHSPAIGDVPEYIVPVALRGMDYGPEKKKGKKGVRARQKSKGMNQKKFEKKQANPLHSFTL